MCEMIVQFDKSYGSGTNHQTWHGATTYHPWLFLATPSRGGGEGVLAPGLAGKDPLFGVKTFMKSANFGSKSGP